MQFPKETRFTALTEPRLQWSFEQKLYPKIESSYTLLLYFKGHDMVNSGLFSTFICAKLLRNKTYTTIMNSKKCTPTLMLGFPEIF